MKRTPTHTSKWACRHIKRPCRRKDNRKDREREQGPHSGPYLQKKHCRYVDVFVHDPYAYPTEVKNAYGIDLITHIEDHKTYDAVGLAVKHHQYLEELDPEAFKKIASRNKPILLDVNAVYSNKALQLSGVSFWRL